MHFVILVIIPSHNMQSAGQVKPGRFSSLKVHFSVGKRSTLLRLETHYTYLNGKLIFRTLLIQTILTFVL